MFSSLGFGRPGGSGGAEFAGPRDEEGGGKGLLLEEGGGGGGGLSRWRAIDGRFPGGIGGGRSSTRLGAGGRGGRME